MRAFALRECLAAALGSLRVHALRSSLAALAVAVGVATVTTMSAVVAGFAARSAAALDALGPSVLFVRRFPPGRTPPKDVLERRRGLRLAEAEALARLCPAVTVVAPWRQLAGDVLEHEGHVASAAILATSAAYADVYQLDLQAGRFFSEAEAQRGTRVVVLGADLVDALFPGDVAVQGDVFFDGQPYRVVGTLRARPKALASPGDDGQAFIPLGMIPRERSDLGADLRVASAAQAEVAAEQVRQALRALRHLRPSEPDDFAVFTQAFLLRLQQQWMGALQLVGAALSSIALVVGAVGITNVQLVAIAERTREIGVRRALGATRRLILWQFLLEAVFLAAPAALAGVILGGLAALLLRLVAGVPAVVQPAWAAFAFALALLVGAFAGAWPAVRAAKLDPVTALRYE